MIKYTFHKYIKVSSQKGGALIYILIAIALLAALTSTFMDSGGQSSRTQNAFKVATVLNSQARLVRAAIQDCVLRFPEGENAIAETGYVDPYPLNPTSEDPTYTAFDNGDPGTYAVSDLRCPGAAFDSLFSGTGEFSSYLPPAPDLMEPWTYFNGSIAATGSATPNYGEAFDGVYFQIQSDRSDPFIGESFQKIDELRSACEVDHQVGTGSNGCEAGNQCLRFWIIRRGGGPTGSADTTNGQNPCP